LSEAGLVFRRKRRRPTRRPFDTVALQKRFAALAARWFPKVCGTYLPTGTLLSERRAFMLKSRLPQSEYPMNIFYIIGVIVVVLFVAGMLGLHA
jgi:hypothetical protein